VAVCLLLRVGGRGNERRGVERAGEGRGSCGGGTEKAEPGRRVEES